MLDISQQCTPTFGICLSQAGSICTYRRCRRWRWGRSPQWWGRWRQRRRRRRWWHWHMSRRGCLLLMNGPKRMVSALPPAVRRTGQDSSLAVFPAAAASRLRAPSRSTRASGGAAAAVLHRVLSSVSVAPSRPPALGLPGRGGGAAAPTCSAGSCPEVAAAQRAGTRPGQAGSLWNPGGGSQPPGAPLPEGVPSLSWEESGPQGWSTQIRATPGPVPPDCGHSTSLSVYSKIF